MRYSDSYDNEGFVPDNINSRWESFNANPKHSRVGDCTVRAISIALNQDWYSTYVDLCVEGLKLADMPSADAVWGQYLKRKGFKRSIVPCDGLCTTVREFCEDNPTGTYIVCPKGHLVAIVNGRYLDTWDSGDENIIYFWKKEENEEHER